ncbi:hypothetical protein C1D41_004072 [Salmonella enterica subsp. enterica serovar Nottingham]|nr:hypothetical protein [Salmonella enterica subsp. enterica serovar Nottingham]ECB1786291.1 hypothetical protein [Salmonella enterica subsp. enterica serovar Nottingham]EDX6896603.1 hypothetical protein [Salmonella enterica subsp. enterica serovar Nottingham]
MVLFYLHRYNRKNMAKNKYNQILSLYAKSMTPREIISTFKEMHAADVSPR